MRKQSSPERFRGGSPQPWSGDDLLGITKLHQILEHRRGMQEHPSSMASLIWPGVKLAWCPFPFRVRKSSSLQITLRPSGKECTSNNFSQRRRESVPHSLRPKGNETTSMTLRQRRQKATSFYRKTIRAVCSQTLSARRARQTTGHNRSLYNR